MLWHGIGDADSRLGGVAEVLARRFGRLALAPDAPGFDRSEALPRSASYHPAALARLALRLLDELGVERSAFVGHSWGGAIGCHAAADPSRRISALVLLDGGYVELDDWERRGEAARTTEAEWVAVGRQRRVPDPELWARALHSMLAPPTVASVYSTLRRAGVPVLLLAAGYPHGSEAGRAAERGLARLRAALPAADVRVLPGLGHDLPGEAGPEVGRLVAEWLARYRGSA